MRTLPIASALFAAAVSAGCTTSSGSVATSAASHAITARAPLKNPKDIVVRADSGGYVASYAMRVGQIRQGSQRVRLAGRCDSACTLYLGLPAKNVCVEPGAYFRFHKATGRSARTSAAATRYLVSKYPGWVRSWIAANGGLTTSLKTMDFAYASKFLPVCGRVV